MSAPPRPEALAIGGVALDRVLPALRTREPMARACYVYDLDLVLERARRITRAFAGLDPLVAFALKANSLPALLERLVGAGLGADAASLGELELAHASGFRPERCVLNGNGKTPEEAAWAARHGVHSVNADSIAELDRLQRASAESGRRLRVALRVNPGIDVPGHRYIATGGEEAKFGIAPAEALAAWTERRRWPDLALDGLHLHVGSQQLDPAPLEQAVAAALALAREAAGRGAPLSLINLGGGFGIDYANAGREFPIESYAANLREHAQGVVRDWVIEPGRWLVAPAGVLLSEVVTVKDRGAYRFVVLAAGMNDLLRPALYRASHRIEAVTKRPGASSPAILVGPVCESADVFTDAIPLPPLEPGDCVAIHDVGAYGAVMASNYNGRGRLAELVASGGELVRARPGETPQDLVARRSNDRLPL